MLTSDYSIVFDLLLCRRVCLQVPMSGFLRALLGRKDRMVQLVRRSPSVGYLQHCKRIATEIQLSLGRVHCVCKCIIKIYTNE